MRQPLLSFILCCLGSTAIASEPSSTININVSGIEDNSGQLMVAVYDQEDNWLEVPKSTKITFLEITGKQMQVTLKDIPYGKYAISVIHDKNKNKKMDMSWFPYPHPGEVSGTSNNATATIGPPAFNDAVFSVANPSQNLNITLGK